MFRQKIVRPEIKEIDPKTGRVGPMVLSDESEDRDGDIIRQRGWKLGDFHKHPILIASHNYYNLLSQIGEWDLSVKGTELVGTATYYIGRGNKDADWGFELAEMGKAAYSVGFIPIEFEEREAEDKEGDRPEDIFLWPSYEFTSQELLEVSHVTIPSNRNALQMMAKGGGMHPVIGELVREQLGGVAAMLGDCSICARKDQHTHTFNGTTGGGGKSAPLTEERVGDIAIAAVEAALDAAVAAHGLTFAEVVALLAGKRAAADHPSLPEDTNIRTGAAMARGIEETLREVAQCRGY